MIQKKTVCFRISENTNDKIEQLAKGLCINKSDVIEQAIKNYSQTYDKNEELQSMKQELEEMKNDIKVIRLYHILDTLKRSDYSNNKDVPSLNIKFDADGKYGNKGDYVIRKGDVEKLKKYLKETTNYYDKTLAEIISNKEF